MMPLRITSQLEVRDDTPWNQLWDILESTGMAEMDAENLVMELSGTTTHKHLEPKIERLERKVNSLLGDVQDKDIVIERLERRLSDVKAAVTA